MIYLKTRMEEEYNCRKNVAIFVAIDVLLMRTRLRRLLLPLLLSSLHLSLSNKKASNKKLDSQISYFSRRTKDLISKSNKNSLVKNSPSPLGYERVRESKTLIVVCLIVKIDKTCCPLFLESFKCLSNRAKRGAPRGLGRPNCSPLISGVEPLLPGQTRSQLFGDLFLALDALFC